jgi:hypothetical protein
MDNQAHGIKPAFRWALSRIRRKGRVRSPLWQWLLSRNYPGHRVLDGPGFFESLVRAVAKRAPDKPLSAYLEELAACAPLHVAHRKVSGDAPDHRMDNPALAGFYYAFVREVRPSCIVETGTATGAFTALMLAAMEANNHGELISIDIPPCAGVLTMDTTVLPDEVGCMIPPEFRGRWKYLAGDAKLLLPKLLAEKQVDIFIHDSLHTRTHMSFEFAVARALMGLNTVIASDDAMWNSAWLDFVHTHELTSYSCVRNPNLCVAVNVFDEFETAQGLGIQR